MTYKDVEMSKNIFLLSFLFLTVSQFIYSQSIAPVNGSDKNKSCISKQYSEQTKEILLQNQSAAFEENLGQLTDSKGNPVPSVLYKVSTPNMEVFVTQKGLSYFFLKYEEDEHEADQFEKDKNSQEKHLVKYCRVDMQLQNALITKSNIISEFPLTSFSTYYYPNCPAGVKDVRKYKKITIKEVYPGIDWVIYFNEKNELKYDFIVSPGADYNNIKINYLSEKKLNLQENGDLLIRSGLGNLQENAPVSYLLDTEERIGSRFVKIDEHRKYNGYETVVNVEVQQYDKSKTLVIDPQVLWFTDFSSMGGFIGIGDITVNKVSGDVLITGYTSNPGMPLFDPAGGAYFIGTLSSNQDIFVTRLNSSGVVLWSTFIGGNSNETGYAVEWDGLGNIFLTGQVGGTFPTLNPGGGAYFNSVPPSSLNSFVSKFSSSGTLVWSTYMGGSFNTSEAGYDIVVNNSNEVFIVFTTAGNTMPTQNPIGGAYFQASNPGGATGNCAYIAKFSNNGNLLWGTYFGGANGTGGTDIALNRSTGSIYITGPNINGGLPALTNAGGFYQGAAGGANDTYVAAFNNTLAPTWVTYLGGSGNDYPCAIHCDNLGNIVLTGITSSANFPITNPGSGAYYQAANAGGSDIFVCKFTPATNMLWSTYYGGSANDDNMSSGMYRPDITTDNKNNIYVTGMTSSSNFPTFQGCGNFLYTTGCNVILQFCPSGRRLWATKFGEVGSPVGTAARFTSACDIDNNTMSLYAGGEVYGPNTVNPLVNPGGGALFNTPFTTGDCSFIIKFKILPVTLNTSTVNATTCNGCNGSATVTANCGIAPYTYSWSNGQTTQTATALCAGTYSVIVNDAGCAQDTAYVTIHSGGGGLTLAVNSTNAACGINNGSATATPGAGTAPYVYTWSNGQTNQTATNLSVGTYTVSITDAGGCFISKTVSITQPSAIVVNTIGSTQIICTNTTTNITASASGGSTPYAYSWSNSQTTSTATGLAAGTYTVTATDALGCSSTQSVSITKVPMAFISKLDTIGGTCGKGGSATVYVYGGIQPYAYAWNGTSQTTATPTGLAPGNYTVTVTDGSGCNITQTFIIGGPPQTVFATFTYSTACVGTPVNFTNTGTASGSGITYNWVISPITPTNVSGTTTDFSYTFLTSGSYSVQHSVTVGTCTASVTTNITVTAGCNPAPVVTATSASVCAGSCGALTATGSNGTAPYTYSWSTGATALTINPCPASTTTYTVQVTDVGGMTATTVATITVNPAVTVTATPTIGCTVNSGSAVANPGGGSSPYTYTWSGGQSAQTATNLAAGNYTVTIFDNKGCTSTIATTISPPLIAQFIKGTANCAGCGCKEWIMVNAADGVAPYSYSWPNNYDKRYQNKLCPGNYTISVTDKNGCNVNVSVNAP
jgi:hypothetical protein